MKFTEKDKAIMIGLLLGDGYISDKGRICIEHCEKLKDYCIFKAKLLHSVCGGKEIKVHNYTRNRSILKDGRQWKSNTFVTYSFKKLSLHFIQFRELLYKNNKKVITKEILNLLDPLSIALWWMDDGCLSKKYNKGQEKPHYMLRLFTYLSKEENELIRDYFKEKYNMIWNVVESDDSKGKYVLRCGLKEGFKFLDIIRDIVNKVPGMEYKVSVFDTSAECSINEQRDSLNLQDDKLQETLNKESM